MADFNLKKTGQETPANCAVSGCHGKYSAKGLCRKHYFRMFKSGTLETVRVMGEGETAEERFWSKVNTTPGLGPRGDCWEWLGSAACRGYARAGYKGKQYMAHRLAWYLYYGVEVAQHLLHSCDNRKCVNINHLREGTQAENMADAVSRGRMTRGERHHSSKVTEFVIRQIRQWRKNGETLQHISTRVDMSITAIHAICVRKSWGWLLD